MEYWIRKGKMSRFKKGKENLSYYKSVGTLLFPGHYRLLPYGYHPSATCIPKTNIDP